MNPRTIPYLHSLLEKEASIPDNAKYVSILFDAVAKTGTLQDLQARIDAAVAFVDGGLTHKRAVIKTTLAFDLIGVCAVQVAPATKTLSDAAHGLRTQLLHAPFTLASAADLDALDMPSACTCPLLQWQWLNRASEALGVSPGATSMRIDFCPQGLPQRTYRQSLENNVIPLVQLSLPTSADRALCPLLAHHLVAQQFAQTSVARSLPYKPQGTPETIDWRELRMKKATFAGEALVRLTREIIPGVSPYYAANGLVASTTSERRPSVQVLVSEREGALVQVLAALVEKYKGESRPLLLGRAFMWLPGGGHLFDLGAVFNALVKRLGSATAVMPCLLAMVVTANQGHALLEGLAESKERLISPDGFIEDKEEEVAARWYVSGYIRTLAPRDADKVSAPELAQRAYRQGLRDLPRFSTVYSLVAAAHRRLFPPLGARGKEGVIKGAELLTLLRTGGGERRFLFDLSHGTFTCVVSEST